MAYRIEGRDIVVSGFENGISDSPHKGISDMRNVDIISVPGEASVAFSPTLTTSQTPLSGITFTVTNAAGSIQVNYSGTAISNNMAITVANSGGGLPGNLSANVAYYVLNATSTFFNVALSASGSLVAYSSAGTGTQTFTTINMSQPKFTVAEPYKDASSGLQATSYHYYSIDTNERVWFYYNNAQWVYMNNLNGNEANAGTDGSGNGLVIYPGGMGSVSNSYLFSFRTANIDYIKTFTAGAPSSLSYLTTSGSWSIGWQATSTSGYTNSISHQAIVGQDNKVYFCNGSFVGSIGSVGTTAFNPAGVLNTDYTFNLTALSLPKIEIAQSLAELGVSLLIGGIRNQIYPWDRVSTSFTYPILLAENNIVKMVTSNTNCYVFTGQRGRIYVTNGTQADLFFKVPDHLSNTINPYFTWGDALYNRNQLYFGIQATDNAGVAINQYGGTWAIDLKSKAMRLVTQQSYGSYSGITSALCPILGNGTGNGFGLLMGWYTSSNTTGGIDQSSSTPYTGGQSYIDGDIIPIGTFLNPNTPAQVEWKVSVPLVSGETIALSYRSNLTSSYTSIPTLTSSLVGVVSDLVQTNFQKVQWVQLRATLTSTASSPSYCRLTEFRIREYISPR